MRKYEWQLVVFTILTQMSVGTFFVWGVAIWITPEVYLFSNLIVSRSVLSICLFTLGIGVVVAGTHMSQPLRFRLALSNPASSWLSREALLGSGYGGLILIITIRRWLVIDFRVLDHILVVFGVITGFGLVFTISRIYMLRTVPIWNHAGTPISFFLTALLLGMVTVIFVLFLFESLADDIRIYLFIRVGIFVIFVLMMMQLFVAYITFMTLNTWDNGSSDGKNKNVTNFRGLYLGRWITALLAVSLLFILLIFPIIDQSWVYLSFMLIITSEVMGRLLFYGQYKRVGF